MRKLSSNGEIGQDDWSWMEEDSLADGQPLPPAKTIVPLSYFSRNIQQSLKQGWGVWLSTDADVETLRDEAKQIPLIAINFPAFADGRGFSQARMLRNHCSFTGELLAAGAFMQDQLCYLKRCGFDSFTVADDADETSLRESLQDFSDGYQADARQPKPLFLRR